MAAHPLWCGALNAAKNLGKTAPLPVAPMARYASSASRCAATTRNTPAMLRGAGVGTERRWSISPSTRQSSRPCWANLALASAGAFFYQKYYTTRIFKTSTKMGVDIAPRAFYAVRNDDPLTDFLKRWLYHVSSFLNVGIFVAQPLCASVKKIKIVKQRLI